MKKSDIKDMYFLSPMQEGMLLHYLMNKDSNAYFEQMAYRIHGEIDHGMFDKIFNILINRYDVLRTAFVYEKVQRPVQVVLKKRETTVYFEDISNLDESEKERYVIQFKNRDKQKGFDLLKDVLIRLSILKIADRQFEIIWSFHHILMDGWCTTILIKEMLLLYRDLQQGKNTRLPVVTPYKNYIQWLGQQDRAKAINFWKNYLAGYENHAVVPGKEETPDGQYDWGEYRFEVNPKTTGRLIQLSDRYNVTVSTLFQMAWGILLQLYNDIDDVVFGSVVSGRPPDLDGIETMVGLFINTNPVRIKTAPGETVEELLARLQAHLVHAKLYEFLPLVDIQTNSLLKRELIDHILIFENYPVDKEIKNLSGGKNSDVGFTVENVEVFEQTTYDLNVIATLSGELSVNLNYNTLAYSGEIIRQLSAHLVSIFQHICSQPQLPLNRIEIISQEEKELILNDFNDTSADFPGDKTLIRLFEEQVAQTPDAIAVIGPPGKITPDIQPHETQTPAENRLTYSQLNRQSRLLSAQLQKRGISGETIVALMAHRSLEMMIGMFAILKAGAAYLPIDPELPRDRINFMLKDSSAGLVLQAGLNENIPVPVDPHIEGLNITLYDFEQSVDEPSNSEYTTDTGTPSGLAYVIYTSGSTGKPKGVMIEHRSIINRLNWMQRSYPIGSGHVILQKTSFTFDVSLWELFWWSFTGASMCLLGPGDEKFPGAIIAAIEANTVTTMHFVPSMLNAFLDHLRETDDIKRLASLSRVFTSGEALATHHVESFNHQFKQISNGTAARLINLYGPTEAAVDVSYFNCPVSDSIETVPIGKPIDNTGLYIVNSNLKLQPIGIPGELCIAGIGLARGYLNNPVLTRNKFVTDPFKPGERWYRTGDLSKWMVDGNIQFLGRRDHQVKIRGYRIELGEIENQLLRHPRISQATVLARTTGSDPTSEKHIYAYFASDSQLNVAALKNFLSVSLPPFMIPAYILQLENIPLTPNGKVDRKTLESYGQTTGAGTAYAAPGSQVEKTIAGIWTEILGLEKVGLHDNFFDIGGHSINIIKVNNKLNKEMDKSISIPEMFRYPTIASLANYFNPTPVNPLVTHQLTDRAGKADNTYFGETGKNQDIAVIGMAGRFPGASNIDEFWENLKNGIESVVFFQNVEMEAAGVDTDLLENPDYIKAAQMLENKDRFDARFFNYTPIEAQMMSPQMRILHECAWETFENAGYVPDLIDEPIGLYAGASSSAYWEALLHLSGKSRDVGSFAAPHYADKDFTNARISYKLNMKGPVFSVHTACSTSLVAIHLASRALVNRECSMALAGGATVMDSFRPGYMYQEGMILSPDGHCRAFDAKAKGTVGGDGVGMVLLKPFQQAFDDRDHIFAIIKGSAINNDGNQKVGFTAPSVEAQADVILTAQQIAGTEPHTIGYIETHGTGTVLGDPVEFEALSMAFKGNSSSQKSGDTDNSEKYCAIGSVKTNVGHLDVAAGVAGFIKTVLTLSHRLIPPSLHFELANPTIDFENSPFFVNTTAREWTPSGQPLRAGVSSFGIGGTNAHLILEEAPPPLESHAGRKCRLLMLSAKTESALERITRNVAAYLRENSGVSLDDVAYTLQVGRKAFPHRKMFACHSVADALDTLTRDIADSSNETIGTFHAQNENSPVVFMFPGQGSQYVNMGAGLYREEPRFRDHMDHCFKLLTPLTGYDLKQVLFPSEDSESLDIQRTDVVQPLLFIFEYSLSNLLLEWGIQPAAMIGHSIGEYTAACLAGVFSLEDALKLVVIRGKLMQQMPGGSMLSVPLPEAELTPLIAAPLAMAAINSSSRCVVSGSDDEIEKLKEKLHSMGHDCRLLHTSHAFHSEMMQPVCAHFESAFRQVRPNHPKMAYISNVSGDWVTPGDVVNPDYWTRHLRDTVRFSDGLEKLLEWEDAIFIEVGPGKSLSSFVRQHLEKKDGQLIVNLAKHPKEDVSDLTYLLEKTGQLWLYGERINWERFYTAETRYRLPLPTYPFEGGRFWINPNLPDLKDNALEKLAPNGTGYRFETHVWKLQPLSSTADRFQSSLNWLIFSDESGIGNALAERLKKEQQHVVTVTPGSEFKAERDDTDAFFISPSHPGDYQRLFARLKESDTVPDRIVHLWTITHESPENQPHGSDHGFQAVEPQHDMGFYSLLHIANAINSLNSDAPVAIDIQIVSNNVRDIAGEVVPNVEKSSLLGAANFISNEFPQVNSRHIDIVLPSSGSWQWERLIRQIFDEFINAPAHDRVAFRNDQRWVQSEEPVQFKDHSPDQTLLREHGFYLITGGPDDVSLSLAHHLSRDFEARVILTLPSGFPSRYDWTQQLAQSTEHDLVVRSIKRLIELETSGAELLLVPSNFSGSEQLNEALRELEISHGKINGVIHVSRDFASENTSQVQALPDQYSREQFKESVCLLITLEEVLRDKDIDFCQILSVSTSGHNEKQSAVSYALSEINKAFVNHHNRVSPKSWNSSHWNRVSSNDTALLFKQFSTFMAITQLTVSPMESLFQTKPDEEGLQVCDDQSISGTITDSSTSLRPRPQLSTPYRSPDNPLEEELVGIWQQFLGISKIGVTDDFFELGGDSLKSTIVISKIFKETKVKISLDDFFMNPTIKAMAEDIDTRGINDFSAIEPVEDKEYYPCSLTQKRFYILQNLTPGTVSYNLPVIMVMEGEFDTNRLDTIFESLVKRHESLRTSFQLIDGEPRQTVYPTAVIDIEHHQSTEDEASKIVEDFVRPFQLDQVPLSRVALIKLDQTRHIFMIDMHHIITDGLSSVILSREFTALYENNILPPLAVRYRDFAHWQNCDSQQERIREQGRYWLRQFEDEGEIPILRLRTDYPRPPVQSYEGA